MAARIRIEVRGATSSAISGRATEWQEQANHINRLSRRIETLCAQVEDRVNRSGGSRLRAIVREYGAVLARRRLIRSRSHYNTLPDYLLLIMLLEK